MDNARQQFQRRRFARTVRAKKCNEFAFLDLQIDAANCVDFAVASFDQAFNGRPDAFLLLIDAVTFCQIFDFDYCHRQIISLQRLIRQAARAFDILLNHSDRYNQRS